jgi:H+/Cl- antiporter ClcA
MATNHPFLNTLNQAIKWLLLSCVIGMAVGSATALFLASLNYVTIFRENNSWVIYGLPFIGLLIAFAYNKSAEINKGNNLLIESYHQQELKKPVPFLMAPLVLLATLLTHLVGGSAGREGTAVQMGGAIADQFTSWFKLSSEQRKTILIMGISAGFAAVFGTPWAGAVFALEIMSFRAINPKSIIPGFLTAFIAHSICLHWNIIHTTYTVNASATINFSAIAWAIVAGILFGLTALVFSYSTIIFKKVFLKINKPLLIAFIGGIVLLLIFLFTDSKQFMGIGIPSISNAFQAPAGKFDFLIKLLLTSFTLSVGFKGGEVTPLFFIGATLGSALIIFIPLPLSILTATGFVAVFSGATHCVIASIVMGFELFGMNAGLFVGIAATAAYYSSGVNSIYSAKVKAGAKYTLYNLFKHIEKL